MRKKRELYALVAELDGRGYSPRQIGAMLGYTHQRILQIRLLNKGKPPTFDDLPPLLRERIANFLIENERQARLTTSA